jgi:hypothetical protein
MQPWMWFVIAVLAILFSSIMRGPRTRQRSWGEEESDAPKPRRSPPPPLPRRRLPAPPLARAVTVVEPPKREAPPPALTPVAVPQAKVETRPSPTTIGQLQAMLKHRQTLRTSFMLREVLDPPLCRRRRLR